MLALVEQERFLLHERERVDECAADGERHLSPNRMVMPDARLSCSINRPSRLAGRVVTTRTPAAALLRLGLPSRYGHRSCRPQFSWRTLLRRGGHVLFTYNIEDVIHALQHRTTSAAILLTTREERTCTWFSSFAEEKEMSDYFRSASSTIDLRRRTTETWIIETVSRAKNKLMEGTLKQC